MSSLARKFKEYPAIVAARVDKDRITAQLSDGREVAIPMAWFPRLLGATKVQRSRLVVSPGGYGIHWPEVDEDISIKAFLD